MHFTYGVTILKSIIIVTLLIVYYQFFFKDVIENYSEGLTNIATTLKVFDESEIGIKAPALAVCMKPAWKKEILEKYNITNQFFMLRYGSFEHLNGKKTMKEIITEASFRMKEDFNIVLTTYQQPLEGSSVILNVGPNIFTSNGDIYSINVTEVFSIPKGMCYILQSNLSIVTKYSYPLSIILQNNITQTPNQMQLTVTSDDDAFGIVVGFWGDAGHNGLENIQFNNKTSMIQLQETIKTRIIGCNKKGTTYQKCLAAVYVNAIKSSNCSYKCIPMAIKAHYDKYFIDREMLQTCNDLKIEACIVRNLENFSRNITQCESQCKITDYSIIHQILDERSKLFLDDDGERADLIFLSPSRTRYLMREYRIYDTTGMIGTVGGSLGLFLGFSFYGVLSDVLDLCVKKITKHG